MAADNAGGIPHTFELFSQLPNELKCQVNQQARRNYIIFLDVAVLPQRDIILIGDPKFSLRPIQKAFLNENNVQKLQHISFTVDVWHGLRHTHHEFPTATLSPGGVLRQLTGLKDFTLALQDDDDAEFETDSYGYEGEWTEERADEWDSRFEYPYDRDDLLLDSDDEEIIREHREIRDANLAESREVLNGLQDAPAFETDTNGVLTHAGKADQFLRGLEERTLAEMMERSYSSMIGILRLLPIYSESQFAESAPYFRGEIDLVFAREKGLNHSWEEPTMHIRELDVGEMPSEDEGTDWEDMDSEDGGPFGFGLYYDEDGGEEDDEDDEDVANHSS